jgi:hypothetical protein
VLITQRMLDQTEAQEGIHDRVYVVLTCQFGDLVWIVCLSGGCTKENDILGGSWWVGYYC